MPREKIFLFAFYATALLCTVCFGCNEDKSGGSPGTTNPSLLRSSPDLFDKIFLMSMKKGTLTPTGTKGEYTLTLEYPNEEVSWYMERPSRSSGTQSLESYIGEWSGIYESIPPNAVLEGVANGEVAGSTIFLNLNSPAYNSSSKKLVFKASIINSTRPVKLPNSALVVNDVKITVLDNNTDKSINTYSFVQSAAKAYFNSDGLNYRLHLVNVNPQSYYVGDAPDRMNFVYPVELFQYAWNNFFGSTPPNGSLTSYNDKGELMIHIVTLGAPTYDVSSATISYPVTILSGEPTKFQQLYSPSLVIDSKESASCAKLMGGDGYTQRLTVINSCGVNSWLYMLTPGAGSMPEQWDWWQQSSKGDVVWTGANNTGDKYVRNLLKPGVPYHFCIPDRGAPSGNFRFFLEPCNSPGDDCMIGTMAGHDRNGVNTLFEPSFGCIPGTANCAMNPSKPTDQISAVDYFDISAVDGYTIPMYLEVTNAQNLQCSRNATDASMLDLASCPSENTSAPSGYGTTMKAVSPPPISLCVSNVCTGTGYAPCNTDQDCTDGETNMRNIISAGFSLLTQNVDGRGGLQACASPCKYLTGHQLGSPAKSWLNSQNATVGAMADAGSPANTLPFNTASWYCCSNSANATAPAMGGYECDRGPCQDGTYPVGLTAYVQRMRELGMQGYAWQYDDDGGLMNCALQSPDNSTHILLTLCPGNATAAKFPAQPGSLPYLTAKGWNWDGNTCVAVNSNGQYSTLFACLTANMKYVCERSKAGADANPVYHNYCRPAKAGETGMSYSDCRATCTNP